MTHLTRLPLLPATLAALLLTALCGCQNSEEAAGAAAARGGAHAVVLSTVVAGGGAETDLSRSADEAADTLQTRANLPIENFGVFAYDTDAAQLAEPTPNFMYNQKVEQKSGLWSYVPVKYWPEQTRQNGATLPDRVSFFAYSPYVDVVDAEGTAAPNVYVIKRFSGRTDAGDPKLQYQMPADPRHSVDLLWGVAADDSAEPGLPYTDVSGDEVGDEVKFAFRHALAKMNITVQAMYDNQHHGAQLLDSCKVTLERVVVRGLFPREGTLNLNNREKNRANWELDDVLQEQEVVIEGDLLNPDLQDHGPGRTDVHPRGVTMERQNVMGAADGKEPLLTFIPNGKATDYEVTLVYYVTNDDRKLFDRYTRVKNVERSRISLSLENGNEYTLRLLVGLRVVSLSATVGEWGL